MKTHFIKRLLILGVLTVTVCMLAACTNNSDKPQVLTQPVIDESGVSQLITYKGTLLGDSNVIKEILMEKLPAKEFVSSFDITLNRLSITYGLPKKTKLTDEDVAAYWQEDTAKQVIFYNSAALFALVQNLESLEYNIEGYPLPTYIITKADLEAFMGIELDSITTVEDWNKIIIKDYADDNGQLKAFFKDNPLETK